MIIRLPFDVVVDVYRCVSVPHWRYGSGVRRYPCTAGLNAGRVLVVAWTTLFSRIGVDVSYYARAAHD